MKITILISVLAAITSIAGAVYQGRFCDRWTVETSEQLNLFAERLASVPTEFGAWSSVEVPVNEEQFKASKCNGCVSRKYTHAVTGQSATIFLVSGKAYHITIHTPDWCYVAAGYEMNGDPSNYAFDVKGLSARPEFLHADFRKETSTETTRLRILWSYSEDSVWTAPKLAEHLFASKPALYKLYIISELEGSAPAMSEDDTVAFAKDFLPVVNDVLFPVDSPATVDVVAKR